MRQGKGGAYCIDNQARLYFCVPFVILVLTSAATGHGAKVIDSHAGNRLPISCNKKRLPNKTRAQFFVRLPSVRNNRTISIANDANNKVITAVCKLRADKWFVTMDELKFNHIHFMNRKRTFFKVKKIVTKNKTPN